MISADRIDAVVFDMGGVFVIPAPDRISEIVTAAGVPLRMDDRSARFAHHAGVAAITTCLAAGAVSEADPAVWAAYDGAFFASVGLTGKDLRTATVAREASRIGQDSATIWNHPLPENIAAFRRVAEHRLVAVVTNNNGTAAQQCLDLGLCQVGPGPLTAVAAIVDSTVIGVAKPDPRIFAPALAALGTTAARTLYVGDTVHADVRGATAAGMPVVQLDPFDHHAGHSHWRLPDVVALALHLE